MNPSVTVDKNCNQSIVILIVNNGRIQIRTSNQIKIIPVEQVNGITDSVSL